MIGGEVRGDVTAQRIAGDVCSLADDLLDECGHLRIEPDTLVKNSCLSKRELCHHCFTTYIRIRLNEPSFNGGDVREYVTSNYLPLTSINLITYSLPYNGLYMLV